MHQRRLRGSRKRIDDGKVQGGTVEINENNFDKYFNIFNQNLKYKDNRNKIASDLFNYHVKPENKAEMKEWLENQGYEIKEKVHAAHKSWTVAERNGHSQRHKSL